MPLLKVMVDSTHGSENGDIGVTRLLIQARIHTQVVLNLVVSLCLVACLFRMFVWNRNSSPGPQNTFGFAHPKPSSNTGNMPCIDL